MPKLKTNRGAAKRFRKTGSGFKSRSSNRSHGFTGKSAKRKNHLCRVNRIDESDVRSVQQMLPYAK